MSLRHVQQRTQRTPEEIARLRADRERYQREKPTPEQLLAEGGHTEFIPLGELLMLHQLRTQLKRERERQEITLAAMSERTGIDQAALSRFETGRNGNPTLDTVYRIASALGKVISFTCQDALNGTHEHPTRNQTASTRTFAVYLKKAVDRALQDETEGKDDGNLREIHDLCRRTGGVHQNWSKLTSKRFLEQYLWCVGSIMKDYTVHDAYFPSQIELFHQCNAAQIVSHAKQIRAAWKSDKCNLSPNMFEAMMRTATEVAQDWAAFKSNYLILPADPNSESSNDWQPAFEALDRLPMVGWAIGWYLIRNLYGGPFFKPDLHINAIAHHFFGAGQIDAMANAVRELWPTVCSDSRFLPVHLGEVDYILWWHRQATNEPSDTTGLDQLIEIDDESADGGESQRWGRKEPTLRVLQRHGIISSGTELELMPDAMSKVSQRRASKLFRARIGNIDSQKSVIWANDGQAYSLTKLSCMLEQYGLTWVRPKTFQLWRIVGQQESLWDRAEKLR